VKGVFQGEGSKGQNGACVNEVVYSQHGTGELKVGILAQRATTPNKRFFPFIYYHTCVEYCYVCCKNAFVLLIYFLVFLLNLSFPSYISPLISIYLCTTELFGSSRPSSNCPWECGVKENM
jgi:hypothetical protein